MRVLNDRLGCRVRSRAFAAATYLGQVRAVLHDHLPDHLVVVHVQAVGVVSFPLGHVFRIPAQAGHVFQGEMGFGITLVHDTIGHALFVDLAVVYLLLETVVHHETVDVTILLLTVPERIDDENQSLSQGPKNGKFARFRTRSSFGELRGKISRRVRKWH